jgi:hypothetical protein
MSTSSTDGGLASISSTLDIRALAMLPARCAWRSSSRAKASKTPNAVGESWRANQVGVAASRFVRSRPAGGWEVRHRLLLARLGLKPDEQSARDHRFFSTRWLRSAPKRAEPYEGSRSDCIGRIANFDTDYAIRFLLTAGSELENRDARNRAEAVVAALASLSILIS